MADFIRATELAGLLKGMGADTREFVAESLGPLKAQQDEIIKRLHELEERRTMEFAGPHDPSREYRAGDVVQRAGAAWVCILATTETPGASQAWRRIAGDK